MEIHEDAEKLRELMLGRSKLFPDGPSKGKTAARKAAKVRAVGAALRARRVERGAAPRPATGSHICTLWLVLSEMLAERARRGAE